MESDTKKFQENNAELAKALVDHKQIISELKTESLKYRQSYFDLYNENLLLKTQLTFAKRTVLDLFKSNTDNYTDVMRKLGISTTSNKPSSKKINQVPKLIITSCSDGEDEELNISSHTYSENNVKRSPVGRKMNYDKEVNTSLRELKEKKLSERLSPVPDEINKKAKLSPSIKITAYNATKRTAQAHHVAQARLSIINKAKSPVNESKSPTNNIRNEEATSHFIAPSPNSAKQQTSVELISKFTNTPQQVVPGEGTSGKNIQPSRSDEPSAVHSNSIENESSRKRENNSNPIVLLKRLQRQSLNCFTPKKFFLSPKGGVNPSNTVPDIDHDKSFLVDRPNDQYHSHRRNSPFNIPRLQAKHKETRQTMSIEPIKKSSIENKENSPSQNSINYLSGAKENKNISTFKPTLQNSAHRSPLETVQSPNISLVSNKSSIARNVIHGFKLPTDSADSLKQQKSTQNMERQSNETVKRPARSRAKSKEIDDEQPHVRASNSHGDEHHSLSHTIEMQSNDLNGRRVRFRTRSRDNISIDDEQPNYSERLRRHNSTTNYAEPKLNTKMRREF